MDRVASVACPIMVVGVVMLCGGRPTRVSKETPADVANGSWLCKNALFGVIRRL
jgi:hypothetical protein